MDHIEPCVICCNEREEENKENKEEKQGDDKWPRREVWGKCPPLDPYG